MNDCTCSTREVDGRDGELIHALGCPALVGPCDGCGGEMPERGWMKPTGREHEGLPIYEFFCSRECVGV